MGRLNDKVAQIKKINAEHTKVIFKEIKEAAAEIADDLIEIFEDALNDVPGKLVDKEDPDLNSKLSGSKVWCGITTTGADLHIGVSNYLESRPHLNKPLFIRALVDTVCLIVMEKYPEYQVRVDGHKLVVIDPPVMSERMGWIDYFKRMLRKRG